MSTFRILSPITRNIPDELKQLPWGVWIAEPRPGKPEKFNKAPRNPATGIKVGPDKPECFGTFEDACAAYERGRYSGIGVLLTGAGIIGVDIDNARETLRDNRAVRMWLKSALADGAYCEVSPSGTGLRLFMKGRLPGKGRKSGPIEIYDNARFLTVTGHVYRPKTAGEA